MLSRPGHRFRLAPSLDILLPRLGEQVLWSNDGLAISLQVLGSDLVGDERVVRLSVDGGAAKFETKELTGRAYLPPGHHSIHAELRGVPDCNQCVAEALSCVPRHAFCALLPALPRFLLPLWTSSHICCRLLHIP